MKVVFDGKYGCALADLAVKAGLIPGDDNREISGTYYLHAKPFRRRTLEMLLLANEVLLVGADGGLDFSKLQDTGHIRIQSTSRTFASGTLWRNKAHVIDNPYFISTVQPLKPWFVRHTASIFTPDGKRILRELGLSPASAISALFDHMLGSDLDAELRDKISIALWRFQPPGCTIYSGPDCLLSFMQGMLWPGMIYMFNLFKESSDHKALICSNSINAKTITGLNDHFISRSSQSAANACGVLMISIGEAIGSVPKLNALSDVFRLKREKPRQIAGLNDAIAQLVEELKNGRQSAIERAGKLVRIASSDLRRGQTAIGVGQWVTYASLPIGVIEALTGLPPIAGVALGAVGFGVTAYADLTADKRWLSLFRS